MQVSRSIRPGETPLSNSNADLWPLNKDAMCNYMGNERWVSKFANVYHEEFVASEGKPWVTGVSKRRAGTIRTAGGRGSSAGNVTFVNVFEAG